MASFSFFKKGIKWKRITTQMRVPISQIKKKILRHFKFLWYKLKLVNLKKFLKHLETIVVSSNSNFTSNLPSTCGGVKSTENRIMEPCWNVTKWSQTGLALRHATQAPSKNPNCAPTAGAVSAARDQKFNFFLNEATLAHDLPPWALD